MKTKLVLALTCFAMILLAACATPPTPNVAAVSLAVTPTPAIPPHPKHQTYDPTLPPASSSPVKEITLHVKEVVGEVADGVPVDL